MTLETPISVGPALSKSSVAPLRLATSVAILLISSDLDELYALSDKIAVMRAGAIAGEFPQPFDQTAIGDAMVGAVR